MYSNTTDLVNGWLMMERRLTGFSSVNVRHGMSLNGSYTICFGCLGCLSLWLAASIFLTCWGKKHISIISPNVLWFNNCITFTRHKHHQHLYLPAVRSHGMVKQEKWTSNFKRFQLLELSRSALSYFDVNVTNSFL